MSKKNRDRLRAALGVLSPAQPAASSAAVPAAQLTPAVPAKAAPVQAPAPAGRHFIRRAYVDGQVAGR